MEIRIKVKLLPDADWVDGLLRSGDGPMVVVVDATVYEPGEVFLIRGVEPGAMTQGMLNTADDQGYAIDPIAF